MTNIENIEYNQNGETTVLPNAAINNVNVIPAVFSSTPVASKSNGKVSLFDFGIVPKSEPLSFQLDNGISLQIRRVIPYEDVLDMIQWSINYVLDDRTFISEPVHAIIRDIAIVKYYSNLDCSEIDTIEFGANNLYEFYDAIVYFGILRTVKTEIDSYQQEFFINTLDKTLQSLVAYRNSAAGLMEQLAEKAKTDELDLTKAQDMLKDPEQMEIIHKVMNLVGNDDLMKGVSSALEDREVFELLNEASESAS